MVNVLSTAEFLAELCQHLPGWEVRSDRTIGNGDMEIFSFHDSYRRTRTFGPSTARVNGLSYHDEGSRVRVNHARLPSSVAGDIRRKLLPGLTAYFEAYRAWADQLTAIRKRREAVTKLLMEVAGVHKAYGLNPEDRPRLYCNKEHRHWWQCDIDTPTIEIQCKTTDPEVAAAILEILTAL